MKTQRLNLSDDVAATIRAMIVDGHLVAGERINEVALSSVLGVSRTPLREALARLAAESAVRQEPRLGYFVQPLTVEELEQIYPMRALLDPEALRLAGLSVQQRLPRLAKINKKIRAATSAQDVIALDDAWHLELIDDCPNRVIVDLIRHFIWRTRRYEIALMRDRRFVDNATDTHERIMDAIRAGDLASACGELRSSMQAGMGPIVEWLQGRNKP